MPTQQLASLLLTLQVPNLDMRRKCREEKEEDRKEGWKRRGGTRKRLFTTGLSCKYLGKRSTGS